MKKLTKRLILIVALFSRLVFASNDPWVEITQKLETTIAEEKDLKAELKKHAPEVYAQIQTDSKNDSIKALWGKSLNYDELMKSEIVAPQVLDTLFDLIGVYKRNGRVVHAGAEHTYGYLFSNLKTSFGYKRARWVDADIENGFGFTRGTLGPKTPKGTLLLNVTALASKVAFADQPAILTALKGAHPEIANWSPKKVTRLSEKLVVSENRQVVLRTDFVEFTHQKGANSELLIYSIEDSNLAIPQLITMFPVASDFKANTLNPKNLGENQEIKTRYNAFVEGVTDSQKPWVGTRSVKEKQ